MNKTLTKQHIMLLLSLYITQYLGLAFFTESFIGILRQNGVSLKNISIVYLLGLFWVFRFLWAPIIDNIRFKNSHYKSWIIIFQSLMIFILFLTSFFNLTNNTNIIILLSGLFAFFASSQDIALDALVLKTFSSKHRTTANALKSAGSMIGMIIGGGVGLVIYSYLGWNKTMIILSFFTFVALIQIFFHKECLTLNIPKKTKINFKQYILFCKTKSHRQWILFLILYPITISSAFALITPMLVDLNWKLSKIGIFVHIIGYGIGVLASLTTSFFINKYGKKNILIIAAIGQTLGLLMLLLLTYNQDNSFIVMFIIGFIFSFFTPSNVIMTTLMMDNSSIETPASQFAIQHSIYMFSTIFFSSFIITLASFWGYKYAIIFGVFLGFITIYTSFKINLKVIKQ